MRLSQIKLLIRLSLIGLGLFILFLITTFPYARLQPKAKKMIETGLSAISGLSSDCTLTGFDVMLPLGVQWNSLNCRVAGTDNVLIDTEKGSLSLWPFSQTLSTTLGKKKFSVSMNAGFKSPPTRIKGEIEGASLDKLSQLLTSAITKANPMLPIGGIKLEGILIGKFDLPLKNLDRQSGFVDFRIDHLRLPPQSFLNLLGLPELSFNKSVVKAQLKEGKLTINDLAFLSEELSGKVEGGIEFKKDLKTSNPNLTLKWKVKKSDAMMSSPIGQALVRENCPSPDADGFCTKKVLRMAELNFNRNPY